MGVEDEYHFTICCTKLDKSRSKLFDEITDIVPCFKTKSNEDKFEFLFTCEECDVLKIIVNGINEMFVDRNKLCDF